MAYPILRHTLFPLVRRRFEVRGEENLPPKPPYLIAANHASYLDAVMLGATLALVRNQRAYYLTHDKIVRRFTYFIGERWLGMIPVPSEDKAQALDRAINKLRAGKIIVFFPEGTRNPDPNKLLKGKTGLARLALATGLPVIPLGCIAPATVTAGEAVRIFLDTSLSLGLIFGQALRYPAEDQATFTRERLEQVTREIMTAIGVLCHKVYPF